MALIFFGNLNALFRISARFFSPNLVYIKHGSERVLPISPELAIELKLQKLRQKEALLKASYVEELAEVYYMTLTVLGKEPEVVPVEELAKWEYPKGIG